jgi:hypothetical protein
MKISIEFMEFILVSFLALLVIITGLICLSCYEEYSEWIEYKNEHACQKTGKQKFQNAFRQRVPSLIVMNEYNCSNGVVRWVGD